MQTVVLAFNLLVNFWLLTIVHRQSVRKQLPWFVFYVMWEVFAGCLQLALWVIDRGLYGKLYWWMEVIELALIVAAVRESFLRVFQGFTAKAGFRWSVWTVIGAVVIYSAWKDIYAPPVHIFHQIRFLCGILSGCVLVDLGLLSAHGAAAHVNEFETLPSII